MVIVLSLTCIIIGSGIYYTIDVFAACEHGLHVSPRARTWPAIKSRAHHIITDRAVRVTLLLLLCYQKVYTCVKYYCATRYISARLSVAKVKTMILWHFAIRTIRTLFNRISTLWRRLKTHTVQVNVSEIFCASLSNSPHFRNTRLQSQTFDGGEWQNVFR